MEIEYGSIITWNCSMFNEGKWMIIHGIYWYEMHGSLQYECSLNEYVISIHFLLNITILK